MQAAGTDPTPHKYNRAPVDNSWLYKLVGQLSLRVAINSQRATRLHDGGIL